MHPRTRPIPSSYLWACGFLLVATAALWGARGRPALRLLDEGFQGGVGAVPAPAPKQPPRPPRVAIAGLMRRPVDLALWLKHHRALGITRFYLRLEDSPGAEEQLQNEPDVWIERGKSDASGNNYETLMDRQLAFVNERVLPRARAEKIDWVFHLDADELLEGDLLRVLDSLDPAVHCITIENVEAVYQGTEDSCFASKKFLRCSRGAQCRSYINSKPAARPHADVRLAGPHNFSFQGKIEADGKTILAVPFEKLRILHFDSCSFGAWMEKFAHLSKNARKDEIPFAYYRDSIDAAKKAADVYMKYRGVAHHRVDYERA